MLTSPFFQIASSRESRINSSNKVILKRLGIFLVLALAFYLIYLDITIQTKFDGKRWAIPARVYARPLDIYPGAAISPQQLELELSRLGYRKVKESSHPATWSREGSSYHVHTRPFIFWDGEEPAHKLELMYSGNTVSAVIDNDETTGLVRLEPVEIGSFFPDNNEDRILVTREQLPELLLKSVIAVEDQDFYRHHGIDISAILRAAWVNVRSGEIEQGGSTLTQQLVKNFYLSDERTLSRKAQEALMAIMLDFHYEKDEIITAYANEIYLGQDGNRAIHGFGLASRHYFGLSLDQLDLPRIALLVALVRGPSWYDPVRHPERARDRRNLVIDILERENIISPEEAEQARQSELGLKQPDRTGTRTYPSFMSLLKQQLRRDYRDEDLTSEGLRIFTTLDPWVQEQSERGISHRLDNLERSYKLPLDKLQAAAVVASRDSGEILALVGARQARFAGFNRALDAVRPIGSLIKPAVYLSALMQPDRYTLVTRLDDTRIELETPQGTWSPKNYDDTEHGSVPLHEALADSYNLATVNLGLSLGIETVSDTISRLGIEREVPQVPAVYIGAMSMTPLEVTQMYQTLAAGGFYSPLRTIREVVAADGTPLQRYPLDVRQAVPEGPVYLLNRNLQEVVSNGTGRSLNNILPADLNLAGKTGTSNESRDSWFAGFSGDKVAVVWLGRDDNEPAGLSGATGALQVWGDIMQRSGTEALVFHRPEDIDLHWIDKLTSELTGPGCKNAIQFPFISGSAPTRKSPCIDNPLRRIFRDIFR